MSEPPQTPPPTSDGAEEDAGNPNAAFLPIGITFLVLGLGGLANDSMRGPAFAFLPVGIVFIVLSIRSALPGAGGASAPDPAAGPPGPDAPPAAPAGPAAAADPATPAGPAAPAGPDAPAGPQVDAQGPDGPDVTPR